MFDVVQKKAVSFLSDNSSALLTAGGVVGTVATAVLTGRATFKAAEILEAEKVQRLAEQNPNLGTGEPVEPVEISTTDKIKLVGVQFVPPVLVGVTTIAAIVFANRISAQRAAALAAAYGVSAKQRDEYKAKLEEKLGIGTKKAQTAVDEIQQERIDRRPLNDNVIVVGTGPVLCYDAFSDRYFKSTADHIRRAVQVVNGEIDTGNECKLGVFYHELELPGTMYDDMLGWNIDNQCKITISAMLINDEACLCLEFINLPMPNYALEY